MARKLVYGKHAVAALLDRDPAGIQELWLQAGRDDAIATRARALAEQHGISVHAVPRATLDRMLAGARHQGIAVRYRDTGRSQRLELDTLLSGLDAAALLLVLDGVQDPHNLGACLRTAEAAGAHMVVLPKDRSAPLSPVARRAASGAAEVLPIFLVTNLARVLEHLKTRGIWLAGTTDQAECDLYGTDLTGPLALVVGSEGQGMRRLTAELCDYRLRIPMSGTVSSLNVSVAAGVCLYEIVRQRAGK